MRGILRPTRQSRHAKPWRPPRAGAPSHNPFLVWLERRARTSGPRRIECFATLTWDGGATPVLLLNKADLYPDLPGCVREAAAVAPSAEVLVTSALDGRSAARKGSTRGSAPGKGDAEVWKWSLDHGRMPDGRQAPQALRRLWRLASTLGILARSDRASIVIGAGLSLEELAYLHGRLLRALE